MSKVDMVMPQMGESIAEGTIIKWHKKEGDEVERDEVMLEISTDKVDSEIPSPESGVIKKLLFDEGDTVEVGEVIAHIDTDGEGGEEAEEDKEEDKKETSEKEKAEKEEEKEEKEEAKAEDEEKADEEEKEKEPVAAEAKQEEEDEAAKEKEDGRKEAQKQEKEEKSVATEEKEEQETTKTDGQDDSIGRTNGDGGKFYSPLVRSIAKAEGVGKQELEKLDGSGAAGRITKKDILNYIKKRDSGEVEREEEKAPAYTPSTQPEYSDDRTEVIPMDNMRKSIAKHMVNSVKTSPHVFAVSEADMTNIARFRQANKEKFQESIGTKLTYMPFIIQACAQALVDYPLVNSSVEEDKIIRKKYINIGMAVALENNGLIVPVIKGADGLNIAGLARAANDLAQRARSKKLKPDEVQGGTFSITNMGSFGSLMGLPIINQPQVAILGVGTIQKRPVVIDEAIAIRDMMYISLSFDHRIVDGAMAGQFLDRIAQNLTNFNTEDVL